MAKRLVTGVIYGLKRDDKDWTPRPGSVEDFSQQEIEQVNAVNPAALRLPPDDNADKNIRATATDRQADTPVTGDPVNSAAIGASDLSGGPGPTDDPALNPQQTKDGGQPAVNRENLRVKGAPDTANPAPGHQNIGGTQKTESDDL